MLERCTGRWLTTDGGLAYPSTRGRRGYKSISYIGKFAEWTQTFSLCLPFLRFDRTSHEVIIPRKLTKSYGTLLFYYPNASTNWAGYIVFLVLARATRSKHRQCSLHFPPSASVGVATLATEGKRSLEPFLTMSHVKAFKGRGPFLTSSSYDEVTRHAKRVRAILNAKEPQLEQWTTGGYSLPELLENLMGLFDHLEEQTALRLKWLRHDQPPSEATHADMRRRSWFLWIMAYLRMDNRPADDTAPLGSAVRQWFELCGVQKSPEDDGVDQAVSSVLLCCHDGMSHDKLTLMYTWLAVQTLGILATGLQPPL